MPSPGEWQFWYQAIAFSLALHLFVMPVIIAALFSTKPASVISEKLSGVVVYPDNR